MNQLNRSFIQLPIVTKLRDGDGLMCKRKTTPIGLESGQKGRGDREGAESEHLGI